MKAFIYILATTGCFLVTSAVAATFQTSTYPASEAPQHQQSSAPATSTASYPNTSGILRVRATLGPNGAYCPPKKGYTTPQVSPYKPSGYVYCDYMPLKK